jgi:hypothetical protein
MNLILLLIVSFIASVAAGQEAVLCAGGEAATIDGSVSFSVGQLGYTSISTNDGALDQGVQHSFEMLTARVVDMEFIQQISISPNPNTGAFSILMPDDSNENISYQLYNNHGKAIRSGTIQSNQTLVDMSELPASTYFLYVLDPTNQLTKLFRVLKIN